MKRQSNLFQRVGYVVLMLQAVALWVAPAVWGQTGGEIMPADNYYLAKAMDAFFVKLYGLTGTFEKKPISKDLRPRNPFQKMVDLAAKFNVLFPNALNQSKLDELINVTDVSRTKPGDVYAVLNLMKTYLAAQGSFQESTETKETKTPSDVYHSLRQLAWRFSQIAEKKGIVTNWATSAQVYEAIVTTILPAVYSMAADAKLTYAPYAFPKQPVTKVQPRNIYKLSGAVYRNISQYYLAKGNYEPVNLIEITDCDEITPADVFDLTQVIASELKANLGVKTLAPELASRYAQWKQAQEKIEPGHNFRLLQHIFSLTEQINAQTGK